MGKIDDLVTTWRAAGPIAWAEDSYGWVEFGQPIRLEPWQRAILGAWWEHRDTVTTLAISNIKKTGKTLANAVLLAWRWLSMPGLHFVCGNDLDQAAGRQFVAISEMVKTHPLLSSLVKATRDTLVFTPTGSTLRALAVDAAGNAGANFLTSSHTEAWGVLYEGARRAWEELTPIPGSFYGLPCLRICDSYAGYEGESQTWHDLVDRRADGQQVAADWPIYKVGGLLLFHMEGTEAQMRCFRGTPEQARAYYAEQEADLRPSAYRRLHRNERAANEETFLASMALWDRLADPGLGLPIFPKTDLEQAIAYARGDSGPAAIVAGLDASVSGDTTAVVCVSRHPGRPDTDAAIRDVRVWRASPGGQIVYRTDDPANPGPEDWLLWLSKNTNLVQCAFDPYQMIGTAQRLGDRIWFDAFDQGAARLASDTAFYKLIMRGGLAHPGDTTLREHVQNCAATYDKNERLRLTKKGAGRPIDAAVAASMAVYRALFKLNL